MSRPPLTLVTAATAVQTAPPPQSARPRLGEVLAAQGRVTRAQIDGCLRRQAGIPARLGDLLRSDLGLSEADILRGLEAQFRTRRIDLIRDPPDPDLVAALGLDHCLSTRCVPWRRIGGATVIASVYPDRFEALRPRYEALFGPVMLALVTEHDVTEGMARTFPAETLRRSEHRVPLRESCRGMAGLGVRHCAAAVVLALAALVVVAPVALVLALNAVALAALFALCVLKISAAIAAHRRPAPRHAAAQANVLPMRPERPGPEPRLPVVSLLVPLYREQRVAEDLLRRLSRLKYPRALLDICLVVEHDDMLTRAVLAGSPLPAHARVISVPAGSVRTKPRALNFALDHCRGSIIGVYDAEDAPHPDQLTRVVETFATAGPEVACLQGRLGFYNARHNWLSRCFAIDYAIWFSVVLPGISRLGLPVPLGGTTLFFRRNVLEELGAWDSHNVTEDADLGIRLVRRGYRTELIDSTTLEEANARIWPWVKQRSRWMKGYAMTYASHMRRPQRLWRDLGPRGFLGFQAIFLASLLQVVLAPVLWTWWLIAVGLPHPVAGALDPGVFAAITALLVLSEGLNLVLAVTALRRTGQLSLVPWILTLNPYFMLMSVAALKALAEVVCRPFYWDKTEHGVALTVPRAARAARTA